MQRVSLTATELAAELQRMKDAVTAGTSLDGAIEYLPNAGGGFDVRATWDTSSAPRVIIGEPEVPV